MNIPESGQPWARLPLGGHLPHRAWPDKSIRCTCSACAEIDRLRAELTEAQADRHQFRMDYAELTSARFVEGREIDRLRAEVCAHRDQLMDERDEEHLRTVAELAAAETWHMQYVDEAHAEYTALADAIARVRELCRNYDPSDPSTAYYSRGDVLRALDGSTE